MGNDGDIAYRLGHRGAFPSFGSADEALGLGEKTGVRDQGSEGPYGALSIEKIAAQCGIFHCNSNLKSRLREALIKSLLRVNIPSGAKARFDFAAFAARLKPCPFKTSALSKVPSFPP
jgi:hypothetical protein